MKSLACRPACAACCIAPSISSPIPGHDGMRQGKPAGVPCPQLDEDLRCKIFFDPARPSVCASLQASEEMCGDNREHAMFWLSALEEATSPIAS